MTHTRNYGEEVVIVGGNHDGFIGKISGINRTNPPEYNVTALERPYKIAPGVPARFVQDLK